MIIKQGTEDGLIERCNTYWPPTTATVYPSLDFLILASASRSAPNYYFDRSYLRFNTSSIPAGAIITSAKLWFKLKGKLNDNSFNVPIQVYRANDWGPTLDTEDWGCGNTLVGTKNYADLPAVDQWFSIDLDPSCINKGGITAFETKGNHESGTTPTGYNQAWVYSANSSGNEPYLEISYILPGAMLLMFLS